MINILKSGKDKIFVEKCPYCATEFNYQLEDVTFKKFKSDESLCFPQITCGVCGYKVGVSMRTEEDWKGMKNSKIQYLPSFNTLNSGGILYEDEVKIV